MSVKIITRPILVSNKSKSRNNKYIGISTPTGGSILVDSIHIKIFLVCLPGTNAIAQAEGIATSNAKNVDPSDIITELLKCLK